MPHLGKRTGSEDVTFEHASRDLFCENSGRTEVGVVGEDDNLALFEDDLVKEFPYELELESPSSFILSLLSRAILIMSSSKARAIAIPMPQKPFFMRINLEYTQTHLVIISIEDINLPCLSKSPLVASSFRDLTIHSSLCIQCFPRDLIDMQSSLIA